VAAPVAHAVAIDQGTTGLKIGIVSFAGETVWSEYHETVTAFGSGGKATQDADEWWRLITAALERGLGAVDPSTVTALCTTGMWASTVPVDENGEPVGDVLLWFDSQGAAQSARVIAGPVAGLKPLVAMRWVRSTAGVPSTDGRDPMGHMLHLQHHRPETHRAARWYLEPIDQLSMRFTGVAAATHASMGGAFLTDNRHMSRLRYDADLVRLAGVDASKLPPLVPIGSVVGTVRDGLGLSTSTRVVAGIPDLHAAAVGTGMVRDFESHIAISTSSWIGCPVPFKRTDVLHQMASIPGLRPDSYVLANSHETAGKCLQWLRDALFPERSYDDLLAMAATAPAGANDVLFTPWLLGERSPVDDRSARAGFHNMSIETTGADLVRAVLEGVAHNARWLHEHVERFCKRRIDVLRIFGGGAQSDLWCQIHADVMNRTIERVADPLNTCMVGCALFAGLSLGEIDVDDVRSLVPIDRTFTPNPSVRAAYDPLYDEFPNLYKSQKRMFARLNGRG
jgi:xylulokinase